MESDDVARYLDEHPEFFEEYSDLLSTIYVPHPHEGRAISLSERQILVLRDKNKALEDKLRELIRFGEENDAIGEKMHRLSLELITASNLEAVLHGVNLNLREDFSIPHVVIRVWDVPTGDTAIPEFAHSSADVRAMTEGLIHPYCGGHVIDEILKWFGESGPHLRSFAMLPLRNERTIGLLVLASEDPKRFYAEMGMLYLKRLGDLVSAAIIRHGG